MEIKLRLEEEKDYRTVEEVTREAFWNLYSPGCNEHLLAHKLRDTPQFVKELNYVALHNDKIVGNIAYAEGEITTADKEYKIVVFGPVSVLPEYQNKGIGSKLINHTIRLAREMGYPAILIYGDPEYYCRFGFKVSKEFHITNTEGKFPAAFQILELYPGALNGIKGIFEESDIYQIDEEELEEFEKGFPPKEKRHTKTQERFLEMVNKFL